MYGPDGVYIGDVDDLVLDVANKRVHGLFVRDPNPMVAEEGVTFEIPYSWVSAVGDVVLLKVFPRRVTRGGPVLRSAAHQRAARADHRRVRAEGLHQPVKVGAVQAGELPVQRLYPVRAAVHPPGPELLHGVGVRHDGAVADHVVRVGDDLLLPGLRHVVPGRQAQLQHVPLVQPRAGVPADDLLDLPGQPQRPDYPGADGRVHYGVVDRPPDVVEHRAGDDQPAVALYALGELHRQRAHGAAVGDDPPPAALVPEYPDALGLVGIGRQLSSPSRSVRRSACRRGLSRGPRRR